jgi:hypothetical protein
MEERGRKWSFLIFQKKDHSRLKFTSLPICWSRLKKGIIAGSRLNFIAGHLTGF